MKKIHTLFLIVAILAFGAVFAGLNFPTSPPTVAETTFTAEAEPVNSYQTAQTVQADFDVGGSDSQTRATNNQANEAGFTGDIPISTTDRHQCSSVTDISPATDQRTNERLANYNQTRIVPDRTAANQLKITNRTHTTNKFVFDFAVFRGFGAENQPRGKIWV